MDRGAGDSVRASAGRTVDAAPFVVVPGIARCLELGDGIAGGGLAEGLVGPSAEAG